MSALNTIETDYIYDKQLEMRTVSSKSKEDFTSCHKHQFQGHLVDQNDF